MTQAAASAPVAPSRDGAADAKKRRRRRNRRDYAIFLAFVLPNFAFLIVFAYWPVVYNFFLSMSSWNLIAPNPVFVGFQDFIGIFTDPLFRQSLWVTVIFTVAVVAGSIVFGMLIAVLLNQKLKARGFVRTLVFAPYVLPGAAVATIWLMMFDPHYGVSRAFFALFRANSPAWVTDSHWALFGIIIVYLWKTIGFCAIVYLSALQGMPVDPYEAASLDGAGRVRQFFSMTIPLLSPTTFFLLIMTVVSTFQAFDVIAVMTAGGPGGATTTLSWYIYQEGFKAFNIGYAAAGSVVMFIILIFLTIFQSIYVGNRVHYQ